MQMMRSQGHIIGRFKVRALMREAELTSCQPGAHRYKAARSERPDIPNRLNRQFDVAAPDQVWRGWSYLATVLDLYSRRIVGWAMTSTPDTDLVIKALNRAYEQRGKPKGLMFYSDQDCQYASRKFRRRLWRYRITQSMSRRGNC